MSFPNNLPTEMLQYISSYISNQVDNNRNPQEIKNPMSLNNEAMQNAQSVINFSMSCTDLYNALANERVTALNYLKFPSRLNNRLCLGYQQIQTDLSTNAPTELIKAFQVRGLENNIASLPVLDLKNREENHEYIGFLEPKDLSSPIMQFKDKYGRSGIAMDLRIHEQNSKFKNKEEVLVVFQRYARSKDDWRVISSHGILDHALEEHHTNFGHSGNPFHGCNTCPNQLTWLTEIIPRILSGTDPVFELVDASNTNYSWISFFNPFKYFG